MSAQQRTENNVASYRSHFVGIFPVWPVVLDGDLVPGLDGGPGLHPDAVPGLELEPGVAHAAVVTQSEGGEDATTLDTLNERK